MRNVEVIIIIVFLFLILTVASFGLFSMGQDLFQ